jgi:hypothetical protein
VLGKALRSVVIDVQGHRVNEVLIDDASADERLLQGVFHPQRWLTNVSSDPSCHV